MRIATVLLAACVVIVVFVSGWYIPVISLVITCGVILFLTVQAKEKLNCETEQGFKIILGTLSAGVIVYWVSQGSLSTRLEVDLSGEARSVSSANQRLIIMSMRIANTGYNNVSIESAKLTVVPKTNDNKLDNAEATIDIAGLQMQSSKDHNELALGIGLDRDAYFLTGGTEEKRQISRVLPAADYYDVYLELKVAQLYTKTVSTWRTVTVIPTGKESGKSPSFSESEKAKEKSRGLLEVIMKKLGGGE